LDLDLSRNRLDVCLPSEQGELVEAFAVASDDDGVRGLARRVLERGEPLRGLIESMTSPRLSMMRSAARRGCVDRGRAE
jgi:hypothetical protein